MKLRWVAEAAPPPAVTSDSLSSPALTGTSSSSRVQHSASIWDWPAAAPAAAAAAGEPRSDGRCRLLPALPHAELSVAIDVGAVRFSAAHADRVLVVEQPPHAQHPRRRHGEPARNSAGAPPPVGSTHHAHVPSLAGQACDVKGRFDALHVRAAGAPGLTADGHMVERWFFWLRAAQSASDAALPGSPAGPEAPAQEVSSSGAGALAAALSRCVAAAMPVAGQQRQAALEHHLAAHHASAAGAAAAAGSQGACAGSALGRNVEFTKHAPGIACIYAVPHDKVLCHVCRAALAGVHTGVPR